MLTGYLLCPSGMRNMQTGIGIAGFASMVDEATTSIFCYVRRNCVDTDGRR
jgi:hypothetical protein